MTVNLIPQLAIQETTTLRELESLFDPHKHPQRAGLGLAYHQPVGDRAFLSGDLVVRGNGNADAFLRSATLHSGAWWLQHSERWNIHTGDVDADLPERYPALEEALRAQRRGLVELRPRLHELHRLRVERFQARPEDAFGIALRLNSAIGDLPAVEYFEALGLLGNATFTLVPHAVSRMAYGGRVKNMRRDAAAVST